ncbi:GNAT family N-acetyltransferase [Planococcus sp. CP5-4]|uniref:GNAT family N-acetyltransferase n=1 Tax=unclassified Planococcus (in: firmicutes) TaxID=2662419 RepID=UPI001C21CEC2|nr:MULTISPECIES: GNAT family N-acetyltransferase [unclassified Planococcus (in: firmicutes)]MBU9674467.1 GNAT family N-acetyltransferase [Planococcus sp. CP5-4_YE]MBV0910098.1 GNAT family N-acetyltransferase [Planococcus sp. CP5-4_UN]MBW6064694.1 GNAT family N-acetyltransferase [Planococcus sp. CP5-4]
MKKLETERLEIIPCTAEVTQLLQNQQYDNGPEIDRHLQELLEDPSLFAWGSWLIILKLDGQVIGDGGFKGKPDNQRQVEIGYGLLERYWNKGYASEAMNALIEWALANEQVEKVIAETERSNQASIRVLEKVKMKRTKEIGSLIYWEIQ